MSTISRRRERPQPRDIARKAPGLQLRAGSWVAGVERSEAPSERGGHAIDVRFAQRTPTFMHRAEVSKACLQSTGGIAQGGDDPSRPGHSAKHTLDLSENRLNLFRAQPANSRRFDATGGLFDLTVSRFAAFGERLDCACTLFDTGRSPRNVIVRQTGQRLTAGEVSRRAAPIR